MMRLLVLTGFVWVLIAIGQLRAHSIDSLKAVLIDLPEGSVERVNVNLEIVNYFFYSNPDSFYHYLNEAKKEAKRIENLPEKVELNLIQTEAYYYYVVGQHRKAISLCKELINKSIEYKNYDKLSFGFNNLSGNYENLGLKDSMYWAIDTAISIAESHNIEKNLGSFFQNKANKLVDDGRYNEGITYYLKALDNHEKYGREELMGLVYYSLGLTFKSLGDYKSAHEYFDKSIIHNTKFQNWIELIRCYNGKATAYKAEEKYKEAISNFEKAMEIGESKNLKNELLQVYYNLGNTLVLTGDFNKAEDLLLKGMAYCDSIELKIGQRFYSFGLAELYVKLKKPKKAEKYLKKFEELAPLSSLTLDEKKGYYELKSNYLEATGSFEKALEFLKKARQVTDSINQKQQDETLLSLEKKYSKARLESENELLRKNNELSVQELKMKTLINYGLGIVGFVILFTLVILWFGYRKIKGLNTNLELQKEELTVLNEYIGAKNRLLEQTLEEKDKILYQVSHDFKNQMTSIFGISELLKSEKVPDNLKEHIEIIHASAEDGIDIINEILEETKKDWILKDQEIDFEKMAIGIEKGFSPLLKDKNIKFEIKTNPGFTFRSNRVFVSRILQNLISNSIKYSDSGAAITVAAKTEKGRVVISVADTGKGFTDEQKKTVFNKRIIEKHGDVESFGFGLLIVKDLADKLGATIKLESELNKGSKISIIL